MHPAWEIPADHQLASSALKACSKIGREGAKIMKLGFSTNAVATAGKFKIPTIVIGPGDVQYAHMTNEHCPVEDILDACKIYVYACHLIA